MDRSEHEVRELAQRGYRFALSLTHDRQQAEDILQDAWYRVLNANGPRTANYLFATIRNRFIDLTRRGRLVTFASIDDGDDFNDESASQSDEELFVLQNGALSAAIGRLRPEERAAVYLSAVEEMSARQIAELLEAPRGTVLSLIHRGLAKLRRLVASETGLKS